MSGDGGVGDFRLLGDEEGGGFFLAAAARAPDMSLSKAEGGGFDDIARRRVEERGNERMEGKSEEEDLTEMRVVNGREKHDLKCNANIHSEMVLRRDRCNWREDGFGDCDVIT